MKPLFSIDFEYNKSHEIQMGLVAVAWFFEGTTSALWLHSDAEAQDKLKNLLLEVKDKVTMVAHNVVAEASCFIALGLNPREFSWLDTYVEYRQVSNHNNDWAYGRYVDGKGPFKAIAKSSAPIPRRDLLELDELFGEERDEAMERAKKISGDCTQLNCTLENAILNFVPEAPYDLDLKQDTRHLIMERKESYSQEEQELILSYAKEDVIHLPTIIQRQLAIQSKRTGWDMDKTTRYALWRGRHSANVAIYTQRGIPIHPDRLACLEANAEAVVAEAKEQFNRTCYPIFNYSKGPDGWKLRRNTAKCNEMIKLLIQKHNFKWRKTKTGDYSMATADGEPLDQYQDIHPWLKQFVRVQNLESVLKAYKKPELGENPMDRPSFFRDSLGEDNRLRPWYGPFGTQTGRNAPGAKAFVFAQAAVMRALIDPPKGRVLVELDYGSQEAFIAPVLSGDKRLMAAYASGDPYLAFAKDTGSVPQDATKDSHADIRKVFKATVLGLQYGMGAAKLAAKLTADTGVEFSVDQARELIRKHKEAYPVYYAWKEQIWDQYRQDQKPLILPDGWYLDVDGLVRLSVLNFPIQGAGSSIMRYAIDKLMERGVEVICPIHDSIVFECAEHEIGTMTKIVKDTMLEASERMLGVPGMRVGEPEICTHGKYWETEKNVYDLPKFAKYFEQVVAQDSSKKVIDSLFKFI